MAPQPTTIQPTPTQLTTTQQSTTTSVASATSLPLGATPPSSTALSGVAALTGEYTMVGDTGGGTVNPGATITMTLSADGTLKFHAVQLGETVDDTGTWSLSGATMTISFQQQDLSGNGPYTFDGTRLTIPVRFFTAGDGSSNWTRSGAVPNSGSSPSSMIGPPPPDNWGMWDLSQDAGANGDHKTAVTKALAAVKAMQDVASASLSDNGYNIAITYTDGTTDAVITEHLLTADEAESAGPSGLRRTGDSPQVAAEGGCATLPAESLGIKANLEEPTREGIDPAGGYGVANYRPASQPTPLTSADSPPQDERRALLISPQYDVHMAPSGPESGSIRDAIGHDNIACIQASLTKSGYQVDTILGVSVNDKLASTGEFALATMTDDLLHHQYGVFYFVGHGFTLGAEGELHGLEFGPIDLADPLIHNVFGDQVPTNQKADLRHILAQRLAQSLGLSYDPNDPPINVIVSDEGKAVVVVYPGYFQQIQKKGASFAHSLIWINACSSADTYQNGSLPTAFGAAAFVGWKYTMAGSLIATIAEEAFGDLTDKVRTVQTAVEWARIHEDWNKDGKTVTPNLDPNSMVPLGMNQTPYPTIDSQTAVLVYYMRNAPSSASADLGTNATFVQECFKDYWAQGQEAGIRGPSCQQLQAGDVPTEDELDDALVEVGAPGAPPGPAGRWTLAD